MKEKLVTPAVFVVLIGLFALAANDWKLPGPKPPVPTEDWCKEHNVQESKCEICHPELARGGTFSMLEREPKEGECLNTLVRVHLGPDAAEAAQLAYVTPQLRAVVETLKVNAETMYAPSKHARVAPRLPGIVREVAAAIGQEVEAGAVLATLESPELGHAKAALLQAAAMRALREKTLAQERELHEKRINTGRELLAAETAFEEARLDQARAVQALRSMGLGEDQVREVEKQRDLSALVELRAPFAGRVVEAAAVPGEAGSPDRPLFSIAAMERLWITVDLQEGDLTKVAKDQKLWFMVGGFPDKRFPGRIVALAGEVDDKTRTVRAYADVKNVDGLLRAKMFGRAEIAVSPPEPRLLVPREAVQNDGDCNLVFVQSSKNVFQARKVTLGTIYEGGCEIVGGLAAGETIVTRGSFLLKTEVLRGQMGAG